MTTCKVNRRALMALAASSMLGAGTAAHADTAQRPMAMKMVVPFAPGGSNDVFARLLGEQYRAKLGVNVVVENRAGGGTVIGNDAVRRSPPDGTTLLLTSTAIATSAAIMPKLPYDPATDLVPVAVVARSPFLLVVPKDSPYQNAAQLMDALRAPGNRINYASSGIGAINHISTEMLLGTIRGTSTHIPYKGISGALVDLSGGNVQFMLGSIVSVAGEVKAGRIRPLAITSTERSRLYPDVPPLSATVPGFSAEAWWAVFAPAKTPPALLSLMNKDMLSLVAQPEMQKVLEREGAESSTLAEAPLRDFYLQELDKWRKVVRDRKITAE